MSKLDGANLQIGNNATATQNCTLTANGDGTFTLARGNVGATTQDLLTIDANGVVELTQRDQIKSGTVIATTSGTAHDFTGIPSWVKRITLMLNGVSLSGTSGLLIQLGDSGGIENTGYVSVAIRLDGGGNALTSSTAGFALTADNAAARTYSGSITISLQDKAAFKWISGGNIGSDIRTNLSTGDKALSATLDRIRLTSINGTDTFDAGKINILYEG